MKTEEKKILTDEDVHILAEKIEPYLTKKRYAHTLSVAKEAKHLGKLFLPEEINRLQTAALLHDITKRADLKKQLHYCEEFGIMVRSEDMLSPSVFHAKTAAELAKRDFSLYVDEEIISGVRWHTTGRAGMTIFESIIYLADYIEETRTFEDCLKVRNYFYKGIEEGEDPLRVLRDTLIYSFDQTLTLLIREGAVICSDTVSARNSFVEEKLKEQPIAREE